MIRVKFTIDRKVAIIEDGVVELFDNTGKYIGRSNEPLSNFMDGMSCLPIISILSSGGKADLAYVDRNGEFNKCDKSLSFVEAMVGIQSQKGFVKFVQKTGREQDLPFQQVLFIYPEGTDVLSYIERVGK